MEPECSAVIGPQPRVPADGGAAGGLLRRAPQRDEPRDGGRARDRVLGPGLRAHG